MKYTITDAALTNRLAKVAHDILDSPDTVRQMATLRILVAAQTILRIMQLSSPSTLPTGMGPGLATGILIGMGYADRWGLDEMKDLLYNTEVAEEVKEELEDVRVQ